MTAVLDQSTDINNQLRHMITRLHTEPDFVKVASGESQEGNPETMESHMYADPASRRFPCHTKAAVWLSAAYFAHQSSQYLPERAAFVQGRLHKAAQYFGILPQVEELSKEAAAVESYDEAVLSDNDYALVWSAADNTKQRNYPLRNAAEIKVAAEWFNKHSAAFDFNSRHMIATKIFNKAAQHSVELTESESLEKSAGFGFCDLDTMVTAWVKRAAITRQKYPELAAQAQKVAAELKAATPDLRDFAMRVKVAGVMDEFDTQTNIKRLYGTEIDTPENTLFSITEKVASTFCDAHVSLSSGAIYKQSDLQRLTSADIQDWLGTDFMDECGGVITDHQKLAAMLPVLNKEDANLFEKLASSRGINVSHRTTQPDTAISDDELFQFAEAYTPLT